MQVDDRAIGELHGALKGVTELGEEELLVRQACYKPQLRDHGENEEVGPAVGPVEGVKGLWVATGHDEWGVSNAPATGVVMAEWVMDGGPRSLGEGCEVLDPKLYMG